jgi:hypothetical protein
MDGMWTRPLLCFRQDWALALAMTLLSKLKLPRAIKKTRLQPSPHTITTTNTTIYFIRLNDSRDSSRDMSKSSDAKHAS